MCSEEEIVCLTAQFFDDLQHGRVNEFHWKLATRSLGDRIQQVATTGLVATSPTVLVDPVVESTLPDQALEQTLVDHIWSLIVVVIGPNKTAQPVPIYRR